MCCRQLSSLTKAVHGTPCNTSAGLQVLRSRLGCIDLSKMVAEQAQDGRASQAPCFYNFHRGDRALDKCPRQANLPPHDGWHRN